MRAGVVMNGLCGSVHLHSVGYREMLTKTATPLDWSVHVSIPFSDPGRLT